MQRANCEKMNSGRSWTCLYFLLFLIVQERCDACNWMKHQYRAKNNFCLSLLKEMGGEITSEKGPFPHSVYENIMRATTEDQMRFLSEVTNQTIILFSTISSHVEEVKWDSRKLDDFLNILSYRQLIELKKCTATHAERSGLSSNERKLRRHFRKLMKVLKKSEYSAASIEKIRNVVLHHLIMMDIIAANMN